MKNNSFIKHVVAIFFSGMIILLAAPYNLGYFSLEKTTWIVIGLISLICFLLIEAVFFCKLTDRSFNISFRKALLSLSLILVLLTFLFFLCQLRYYKHMWFDGAESGDILQAFWNTVNNGGFFHYTESKGVSLFLIHFTPLMLIALPFYIIYPNVHTLILIQSVFFCFAALPLFLIASKRLNSIASIVISIGFLLYPYILGPTFTSFFRETIFIAFFMFFAFYFFENNRFRLYLLFLLLTMMARETVPLTCFMFAIYGILKKRPVKWIMSTIILTASYFLLFLLIQKCAGYVAFTSFPVQEAYFVSSDKGSIVTAVINKILNPKMLMSTVIDIEKAKYIYRLLSPCALILPLFSSEIIFIIPQLLIVLLSNNKAFLMPYWHHSVNTSIFLWISTIFTISKITGNRKIIESLSISKEKLSLVMVIFISLLALSSYHTWFIKHEKMDNSYYDAINEAVFLIPQNASVSASKHLLPLVSERKRMVRLDKFEMTDYVLIDEKRKPDDLESIKIKMLKEVFIKEYEIVFHKEGITVYAKKHN